MSQKASITFQIHNFFILLLDLFYVSLQKILFQKISLQISQLPVILIKLFLTKHICSGILHRVFDTNSNDLSIYARYA